MCHHPIITVIIVLAILTCVAPGIAETEFAGSIKDANIETQWHGDGYCLAGNSLQNQRQALNIRAVGASGNLVLSKEKALCAELNLTTPTHPLSFSAQSGFSGLDTALYESYASRVAFLGHTLACKVSLSTEKRPPTTNLTASGTGTLSLKNIMTSLFVPPEDAPYADFLINNPSKTSDLIQISGSFDNIQYTHTYPVSRKLDYNYSLVGDSELDTQGCGEFH